MRVWLRKIRTDQGLSEARVAEVAGIAQPFYHNIEAGIKNPSVDTAKRIALALGFPWTRFFEEAGQSDNPGICGAAGNVGRDERSVPALEH